jgi:hypothetical protein
MGIRVWGKYLGDALLEELHVGGLDILLGAHFRVVLAHGVDEGDMAHLIRAHDDELLHLTPLRVGYLAHVIHLRLGAEVEDIVPWGLGFRV